MKPNGSAMESPVALVAKPIWEKLKGDFAKLEAHALWHGTIEHMVREQYNGMGYRNYSAEIPYSDIIQSQYRGGRPGATGPTGPPNSGVDLADATCRVPLGTDRWKRWSQVVDWVGQYNIKLVVRPRLRFHTHMNLKYRGAPIRSNKNDIHVRVEVPNGGTVARWCLMNPRTSSPRSRWRRGSRSRLRLVELRTATRAVAP